MINTIFLMSSLIPLAIGAAFFFRPRKVLKIQAKFRKRLEKAEKRLHKEHRKVGLCFGVMGAFIIYTYFQPIWIYSAFYVARVMMGLFFPEMFEPVQQVEALPTVFI